MSDLSEQIERLASSLAALHETLSLENQSLLAQDPEPLPTLGHDKEQRVAEMAQILANLAGQLGLTPPASRRQVTQGVHMLANDRLSRAWATVLAKADEAERLNRLNGRLIAEQLRRTQIAVQILQSSAQRQSLYGSDGQTVGLFSPNRTIDEA